MSEYIFAIAVGSVLFVGMVILASFIGFAVMERVKEDARKEIERRVRDV